MKDLLFFRTESFAIQSFDEQNLFLNDQQEVIKLGSLVVKFEEIIQRSGGINVDEFKELLIKEYPKNEELAEEINCAKNLSDVLLVVCKCLPVNTVILLVVDNFKLPDFDQIRILELIHQYEEAISHKESTVLDPSQQCFISFKLKGFEFAKGIKNLSHDIFPYNHVSIVCIVGVAYLNFYIIFGSRRPLKPLSRDLQTIENENIQDIHKVCIK